MPAVTDWLVSLVPIFKIVHVAAIAIWCGSLVVLPLMLSQHGPVVAAREYVVIRRATHITYTLCVTPAAVVAVIAGTWLIFLREVYVPWFFAKLVFVVLLVAVHAWVGHILVKTGDGKDPAPPAPVLPVIAIFVPVLAILVLVLAKPPLDWLTLPEWLLAPRDGQLPFEIPRR